MPSLARVREGTWKRKGKRREEKEKKKRCPSTHSLKTAKLQGNTIALRYHERRAWEECERKEFDVLHGRDTQKKWKEEYIALRFHEDSKGKKEEGKNVALCHHEKGTRQRKWKEKIFLFTTTRRGHRKVEEKNIALRYHENSDTEKEHFPSLSREGDAEKNVEGKN